MLPVPLKMVGFVRRPVNMFALHVKNATWHNRPQGNCVFLFLFLLIPTRCTRCYTQVYFRGVIPAGMPVDCMGRYFAPCKICIPHIPVGYAGGRQKTAPAFSAFATSLWFSNAGAVAGSSAMEGNSTVLQVPE